VTRRNPGVEADTTTQFARVLTEEEAAEVLLRHLWRPVPDSDGARKAGQ
jgi:hypothetical protein